MTQHAETLTLESPRPPETGILAANSSLRRLLRLKMARFAIAFIGLVVVTALLAPVLTPYSPNRGVTYIGEAPSMAHWLGTDAIGRDQLTRLLYGARSSLLVSVMAATFAVTVGMTLGLVAAYGRGIFDFVIMRWVDAMLALPGLILPLVLLAAIGGGIKTVALALGIGATPGIARLMRGQALGQLERDYALAARALGASPIRVMARHIMPNALAPIIVAASLGMSFAVIAEAGLSFLGVGVTPPTATWGTMLATGFPSIRTAPWQVMAPGVSIFLLVLSLNFLGDALRDVLDPRLRGVT